MRTPLLLAVLAVLAALVPAAPRAAVPPLEVGARVGYASAFGDAARSTPMKDFTITSQVPLQLELSARLRPELAAGLYASYGLGRAGDAAIYGQCGARGASCSGRAIRAGAQGRWSFTGVQPFVPWAGAGLGWEWARVDASDPAGGSTVDVNGLELSLQGGGDYRVARRVTVGPYVELGLGRYRAGEVTVSGVSVASGGISHKALHGWLGLGVAGRFEL